MSAKMAPMTSANMAMVRLRADAALERGAHLVHVLPLEGLLGVGDGGEVDALLVRRLLGGCR